MAIKMSPMINPQIQKEIIEYLGGKGYEVLGIDDPIPQDDIDHTLVKIKDKENNEHLVDVEINNNTGKWEIIGFVNTEELS